MRQIVILGFDPVLPDYAVKVVGKHPICQVNADEERPAWTDEADIHRRHGTSFWLRVCIFHFAARLNARA